MYDEPIDPVAPSADDDVVAPRERVAVTWSDDGGYVAAMTALLILPLMIFTAFAVDMGSWFGEATRIQRTADAASLAGVPFMPTFDSAVAGNPGAKQIAIETAKKNGYTDVTVSPKGANRIQVSIHTTAPSFFAKAIGYDTQSLTRSATAEFLNTIRMGSPNQYSGNDPDLNITPNFWQVIESYKTGKIQGDRYSAGQCDSAKYGCSGSANAEYDPDGYIYNVTMPSTISGPIDIQVFDAAAVVLGQNCESARVKTSDPNEFATLQAQYNNNNAIRPSGDANRSNFADRYKPGPYATNRWCSGDYNFGDSSNSDAKTTYIVRAPDLTPLDPLDNPAICAISFDSYQSGAAPINGDIFNALDRTKPANLQNRGTENMPFWKHFRNWASVCNITNPIAGGNYILQVSTALSAVSPPTTTAGTVNLSTQTVVQPAEKLSNGHAFRAVKPSTPATTTGITLSADTRFPIWSNTPANTSIDFYMARITPEYAGERVQLSLFDIGDTSGTLTMTIKTPTDAVNPPTSCTWGYNGGSNNLPSGITSTGCTAKVVGGSSSVNGALITVTVDMPPNYTCTSTDPNGCWFHIVMNTTGDAHDVTTWSATVVGNPVHLIN